MATLSMQSKELDLERGSYTEKISSLSGTIAQRDQELMDANALLAQVRCLAGAASAALAILGVSIWHQCCPNHYWVACPGINQARAVHLTDVMQSPALLAAALCVMQMFDALMQAQHLLQQSNRGQQGATAPKPESEDEGEASLTLTLQDQSVTFTHAEVSHSDSQCTRRMTWTANCWRAFMLTSNAAMHALLHAPPLLLSTFLSRASITFTLTPA